MSWFNWQLCISQLFMIASNGMGDSARAQVETVSFRVAGFLDILDWRPLLFQEPIIAQRACALCGVVYKKAVRLSCVHTLCLKCHAKCVDKGSVCPVDQEPFCEEDVEKLEVSVEYILKRKVSYYTFPSLSLKCLLIFICCLLIQPEVPYVTDFTQ